MLPLQAGDVKQIARSLCMNVYQKHNRPVGEGLCSNAVPMLEDVGETPAHSKCNMSSHRIANSEINILLFNFFGLGLDRLGSNASHQTTTLGGMFGHKVGKGPRRGSLTLAVRR